MHTRKLVLFIGFVHSTYYTLRTQDAEYINNYAVLHMLNLHPTLICSVCYIEKKSW